MANEVWVDVKGTFGSLVTAMTGSVGEVKKLERATGESADAMTRMKTVGVVAMAAVGVGLAKAGIDAVDMAKDFQTSQSKLVATAGESQSNLKMVGDGILAMAGDVGISAQDISKGMYVVESAGHHGADALNVMKAAAQGAKTEQADLGTVADAVTTILQDFGDKAGDAATITSKLITAVSLGKTSFQDLTGAMSAVMPKAAAAGLSFSEIAADLASMTAHGVTARQAAQNMADAISHMQSPTLAMSKAMADFGIQSHDVSAQLSTKGLAGTLQELAQTVLSRMGPAGAELRSVFNQSTLAATDAKKMFDGLPPSLQGVAQKFIDGKITMNDWRQGLKSLPADQGALLSQWVSMQNRAQGFSQTLKSGGDSAKTFSAAMQALTGDSTSMNVALMLSGENTAFVNDNIKKVTEATKEANGDVKGFAEVQGNLGFKMDQAKAALESFAIGVGQLLLPAVTEVARALASAAQWMQANQGPALALGGIILGVLVAALAAWTVATLKTVATNTAAMAEDLAKAAVWVAGKVASYAVVAASAVATAATTAAAWVVANIAMIAATGGIVLAIGLLVAAGVWLATHWDQVWGAITDAASAAWSWIKSTLVDPLVSAWRVVAGALTAFYESAVKPIFSGIAAVVKVVWDNVLRPILELYLIAAITEIKIVLAVLQTVWSVVWGAITAAAQWAWDTVLQPLFEGLVKFGIAYIRTEIALLRTIWEVVWGAVTAAAQWAWDTVLHPLFTAIVTYGIAYVRTEIALLRMIWEAVWGGITMAAQWAWDHVLSPIFHAVVDYGVRPVVEAIGWLSGAWSSAWDKIIGVVQWAWGIIQSIAGWIADKIGGVLNMIGNVGSFIHSAAGSLGVSLPSFADGGFVPGSPGQARLVVAHGGEYVLSRDMLAGRVQPDVSMSMDSSLDGLGGGTGASVASASAGGGGNTVVVINNAGSVIAQRDLVEQIRQTMLQMGTRTSSTYQPYRR